MDRRIEVVELEGSQSCYTFATLSYFTHPSILKFTSANCMIE